MRGQGSFLKREIRWSRITWALFGTVCVLALAPYRFYGYASPIPLIVVAAGMGFAVAQRRLDIVLYLCAGAAAELWTEPFAGPVLLMASTLALLAITCRPRFSLLASACALCILLVAIHLKYQHGGSPLTWQDITYFFRELKDNSGVMATQPTILLYAAAAIGLASACLGWSWRQDSRLQQSPARDGVPRRTRLVSGVARAAAACTAMAACWQLDAYASSALGSPWMFSEAKFATPVSSFLATRKLAPAAQNRKVDTGQFADLVARRVTQSAQAGGHALADIVVFLQESQFNPRAIAGCPRELCGADLPAFAPDEHTADSGELRVHVFGAGTWLTEFEFATGIPHDVYGKAGDYAPFNVAPKVHGSFIRSLKKAGYYTVALYPVRGGMMNAREAYRAYGFDEFRDAGDLGFPGDFGLPDRDMHAATVRVLQELQAKGKPVFLMAVTIFNHTQHGVHMERVPAGFRSRAARFEGDEADRQSLADYLWRTEQFSEAYERTRASVLRRARPSVLVWFGDHQPPFGTAPALLRHLHERTGQPSAPPARFLTWYRIDSNRRGSPQAEKPVTQDIVFLPGLIAQRAGVPLDPWLAANVITRERCGGLYVECAAPPAREQYASYLMDALGAMPR